MMGPMRILKDSRWRVTGVLGKAVLWLWGMSSRLTVLGSGAYERVRKQGRPVVFLMWHGRIFMAPFFFRRRKILALVSPSQDGEIVAQVVQRWGYRVIRGSGSHPMLGAWRTMTRGLLEGGELIIVADGPRGPDRKLKLGALKLAQATGAAIVPWTFSASRRTFLKSWDRFLVFRPFSRVVAVYGEPQSVPAGLDEPGLEGERRRIEALLIRMEKQADRFWNERSFSGPSAGA